MVSHTNTQKHKVGRLRRITGNGTLVVFLLLAAVLSAFPVGSARAAGTVGDGWHAPLDTMPATSAGFLANNCGHPEYGSYRPGEYHLGRDLPIEINSKVYAIANGTVLKKSDWGGSWGYAVFVQHTAADGAKFVALYGHVSSGLNAGATVNRGSLIGTVFHDHLHFGVRPGTTVPTSNQGIMPCSSWPNTNGFVNPLPYLEDHPASKGASTKARSDFNGDGRSDIFMYGPGTATDRILTGREGRGDFGVYGTDVTGVYTPVTGNFDGDKYADILWYGPGTADDRVWYGTSTVGEYVKTTLTDPIDGNYVPAVGDFNGDGRSDILMYGPGAATDKVFYGRVARGDFGVYGVTVSGTYTPVVGDFDGDKKSDVLWYGPGSASDSMWYGKAAAGDFQTGIAVTITGTYTPIVGDFNGDGRSDVMMYGPGTAEDRVMYGRETRGEFGVYGVTVGGTYVPVSGDYDGDQRDDILWYGSGDAPDSMWYGRDGAANFYTGIAVTVSGTYTPIP